MCSSLSFTAPLYDYYMIYVVVVIIAVVVVIVVLPQTLKLVSLSSSSLQCPTQTTSTPTTSEYVTMCLRTCIHTLFCSGHVDVAMRYGFMCFLFVVCCFRPGLPRCWPGVHCHAGSTAMDCGRLLEDDLGAEILCGCHGNRIGRATHGT